VGVEVSRVVPGREPREKRCGRQGGSWRNFRCLCHCVGGGKRADALRRRSHARPCDLPFCCRGSLRIIAAITYRRHRARHGGVSHPCEPLKSRLQSPSLRPPQLPLPWPCPNGPGGSERCHGAGKSPAVAPPLAQVATVRRGGFQALPTQRDGAKIPSIRLCTNWEYVEMATRIINRGRGLKWKGHG
jgi:hypothetical protein